MSVRSELRKLSYREASRDDIEEFRRQINHETNDRGACILMATNVELALSSAIFRVLEWDEETRDRLTSDEGPIATFSQKVHLGRALRIYGPDTYHNLDYIRLIRNAFAHSHVPISFETDEVRNAVALLKQIKPLPPVALPAQHEPVAPEITPREAFRRVCDTTGHNLLIWGMSGLRELEPLGEGDIRPPSPFFDEYALRKPLP